VEADRMKSRVLSIVTLVVGLLAWSVLNRCESARGAPPALAKKPVGGQVTIKGNVLSNIHTGETSKSVFLLAYDGTPEIRAEFERIMAEHYPDTGLDADAALRVQDLFMTRMKYEIDGAARRGDVEGSAVDRAGSEGCDRCGL
jgi:calcineurin-like phosphoesterase family protein